jgi:hypothetical protein
MQLSPWSRVIIEKLIITNTVKKLHALCEIQCSITVFTASTTELFIMGQMNPIDTRTILRWALIL